MQGTGPPTWPAFGSEAFVTQLTADDSVYPYPSWIGALKQTFKKLRTSADIGADPVTIVLTLPPIKFFKFLKINGSQTEWV